VRRAEIPIAKRIGIEALLYQCGDPDSIVGIEALRSQYRNPDRIVGIEIQFYPDIIIKMDTNQVFSPQTPEGALKTALIPKSTSGDLGVFSTLTLTLFSKVPLMGFSGVTTKWRPYYCTRSPV